MEDQIGLPKEDLKRKMDLMKKAYKTPKYEEIEVNTTIETTTGKKTYKYIPF